MADHVQRVERDDDPRRCQAVTARGQCYMVAVEGNKNCSMHGGKSGQAYEERKNLRNYMLTKWQHRLNELADNSQVKSLREEIGLLRMTMESIVNKCNDHNDLLLYSSKIADLGIKIEKLVSSCHRLEASSGQLLDKSTAINFAAQVVEIVGRHVIDADALERISDEVMLAVGALNGPSVSATNLGRQN